MNNLKLETGIQLLTRLTNIKKTSIEDFYPNLIPSGPKPNEVVEIYYSVDNVCLVLNDIIAHAITPNSLGGADAGVLLFNCGEDFQFESLVTHLLKKISFNTEFENLSQDQYRMLQESLQNLNILQIFDADQLHASIHNLEILLIDYSNISLIIFETLPAFYWSEQHFKITKMDFYLKNLLKTIQKAIKQYKVSVLYTRPEYFSSSKETLENLETCCPTPTLERLNYRLQLYQIDEKLYQVNIRNATGITKKQFKIRPSQFEWL